MRRRLIVLTALTLCGSLLLFVLSPGFARAYDRTSPAAAGEGEQPNSPDLTEGVIMVGGDTADLQWTAANLIPTGSTLQNVKVWRNTGAGTPKVLVKTSTETTTVFYRDTPLEIGKQYWYEGIANVCAWSGPDLPVLGHYDLDRRRRHHAAVGYRHAGSEPQTRRLCRWADRPAWGHAPDGRRNHDQRRHLSRRHPELRRGAVHQRHHSFRPRRGWHKGQRLRARV